MISPRSNFPANNARPHTARVAHDFLRHVQTLSWLARSPDLSPVEHVWNRLKRQMPSLELAFQICGSICLRKT
ncbi:HTH_Tnp_Tc3_2 domain-containing protein [Trichonephila clavipes]|nr:HTH_Tnp_Tc3_2 domain-containing protein [Trichonephila clavipes]